MEISADRLKMIIADKECQIYILNTQLSQLTEAYNKLHAENEKFKLKDSEADKQDAGLAS